MISRRPVLPPQVASAARVALIATLLMAAVYGGCIAVLDKMVADRLLAQVDIRLSERLADVGPADATRLSAVDADDDDDDDAGAPVVLWALGASGTVPASTVPASTGPASTGPASTVPASTGPASTGPASTGPASTGAGNAGPAAAPALPRGLHLASGQPVSARIGQATFRLLARRRGGILVVAGQSLAEQDHIEADLFDGEALAAPVLLLAMLAGSLLIGLKALSPVEQSRRRQLEFTADASHELRTPLSVISAETGIALASPRKAVEYRDTLHRIQGEAQRLRGIVDDLLWLARFDSRPPPPGSEPLDLATIAQECADRFEPVARSGDLRVCFGAGQAPAENPAGPARAGAADTDGAGPGPAWISAPPEWIDRLAGVLTDNACRYAGPGGSVRISVAHRGSRVSLVVEDSGPGIPAAQRDRLFDRFHRASEQPGGAGLGLAIADSIVRSTGGHWRIAASPLGGALFEVSWRRSALR